MGDPGDVYRVRYANRENGRWPGGHHNDGL